MGTNRREPKGTVYRRSRASKPRRARETAVAYAADTVGVRELRQNLSVYLEEVKRGRSLFVSDRGQRVAVLRPMPRSTSMLDRLVAEGKMRPPTARIQDLPPPLEIQYEKSLTQVLLEMREEERF